MAVFVLVMVITVAALDFDQQNSEQTGPIRKLIRRRKVLLPQLLQKAQHREHKQLFTGEENNKSFVFCRVKSKVALF